MSRKYRDQLEELFSRNHERDDALDPDPAAQALMSLALTEALDDHASALTRAADASDKYSRRLVCATWALVIATIALVIVAVRRGV